MDRVIDHATIAWSDLNSLEATIESMGLPPTYGGVHDNGITHMSIVGFADGSYLELLSTTDGASPFWAEFIANDAGPTVWAIEVADTARLAKRAIDAGIPVDGPTYMTRERPDGTVVEWDLVFLGDDTWVLPFGISDRTPRRYRLQASHRIDGPISGIGEVVVGVPSIDAAAERFRRLFHYPRPPEAVDESFGARLASFPGRPVTLAAPSGDRLEDRVERFGAAPCAFLLAVTDLETALDRYPLSDPEPWFDSSVAWFESDRLDRQLGIIA